MSKITDKVKDIKLYKLQGAAQYPYVVRYKKVTDSIDEYQMFTDSQSANVFLKNLYKSVDHKFWHYNYTMSQYDSKSWKAYFFISENNVETADTNAKNVELIDDFGPIRQAYKELFRKHTTNKENEIEDKIKKYIKPIFCGGLIAFPLIFWAHYMSKQNKRLNEIEKMINQKSK